MSDEHLIDYTQLSIDNGKESMPAPDSFPPDKMDDADPENDEGAQEQMFSYITGEEIEWREI